MLFAASVALLTTNWLLPVEVAEVTTTGYGPGLVTVTLVAADVALTFVAANAVVGAVTVE